MYLIISGDQSVEKHGDQSVEQHSSQHFNPGPAEPVHALP